MKSLIALVLTFVIFPANASPELEIVALFDRAVMIRIDGEQKLLKQGQVEQGVKLIEATSTGAIVEVDGRTLKLALSQRINSSFAEAEKRIVSIQINDNGQYITTGSINQHPVTFLVDTGATIVAMNADTARQVGLDTSAARQVIATTAGGTVRSSEVMLDRVTVGDIEINNVLAVVLEGEFPQQVLLGMTFLENVEIKEKAGLLQLTMEF